MTDLVELNSGSHKNVTTVFFDQIRLLSNSWGDVNSSFGSISIVAAVRAGCTGGSKRSPEQFHSKFKFDMDLERCFLANSIPTI